MLEVIAGGGRLSRRVERNFGLSSDLQFFCCRLEYDTSEERRAEVVRRLCSSALEKPADCGAARFGNVAGVRQIQNLRATRRQSTFKKLPGQQCRISQGTFSAGGVIGGRTSRCLFDLLLAPLSGPNGMALPSITCCRKGLHPSTAMRFLKTCCIPTPPCCSRRWVVSEEGQQAMAQGGRTPAHPKVAPIDKTRTEKVYFATADLKDFPATKRSGRKSSAKVVRSGVNHEHDRSASEF